MVFVNPALAPPIKHNLLASLMPLIGLIALSSLLFREPFLAQLALRGTRW